MATPSLDTRSIGDIIETSKTLAQGYVADWRGVNDETDPGRRVIGLFARLMELLIERENRIPEKNFVKFLDLVGVEQFPGSPAQVPVTFLLAKDAAVGAVVPVRTRVATTQTETVDAQVFETKTEFFATPARIVAIVNLVPSVEGYAEVALVELPPTAELLADKSRAIVALSEGSGDLAPVPHILYLASQALFGRDEAVNVTLVFALASGDDDVLSTENVAWKRFDAEKENWVDLDVEFEKSNVSILLKGLKGVGKKEVHGHEGYFIAGHLDGSGAAGLTWPTVRKVEGFLKAPDNVDPIAPEFAFANANALDLSKPFLPFGERPRYGDAFYLGSRTAFSPEVLNVTFDITILPYTRADLLALFNGIESEHSIVTDVEWQYLRGDGTWQSIAAFRHTIIASTVPDFDVTKPPPEILSGDSNTEVLEGTAALFGDVATDGASTVRFRLAVKPDINLQNLNGEEAYWLRAILRSKEPYGSEGFVIPGEATDPPTPPKFIGPLYVPPTIETLELTYTHRIDPIPVDRVIAENNFAVADETAALVGPTPSFRPFIPTSEHAVDSVTGVLANEPALYIGLDRALDNAFASLFVHLDEPTSLTAAPLEGGDPRVTWEYLAEGSVWRPLDVTDGTAELTTSGTIGFPAPSDAARIALFEMLLSEEIRETEPSLFWLRARLVSGKYDHPPRVLGIHLNTVMTENRSTISDDVLVGSGNGKPGQTVNLVQSSILAGQLWVREPERPSKDELGQLGDDILQILRLEDPDADLDVDELVDVRGSEGEEKRIWVRWHRVPNFRSSTSQSRHYTLDRVRGVLGFGDGEQGLIAAIGKDNLVFREFASGGGEDANNVSTPLAVKELRTSLPFVDKVFNLAQATGGAAAWSLEDTFRFGPQSIKHRGRAVTTDDYEWMVRERFGQIAKVRCLSRREPGSAGQFVPKPGAVTVIVVPKSAERLPQPPSGLLRSIREYLQTRTLGNIVEDVHVIGPSFQPVSVKATVKASAPREASLVARRVTSALESWFHPLNGGDAKEGWEFGRAVYLSEVFAVMARVPGVDHVQSASFVGAPTASSIAVGENSLTASGAHVIEVS